MAETLNFTKHLRRIVGPAMRAHGFRLSGTRFWRHLDGVVDEVYFQRSQFNLRGLYRVYVNLESRFEDPTSYQTIPFSGRTGTHVRLGPGMGWRYRSEEELQQVLQQITDRLLQVGLPYLDRLRALVGNPEAPVIIEELVRRIRQTEVETFGI